jgi:hypothetical protein
MGRWENSRILLQILNILLVYHLRLGDIARCLPIAKHFADRGHHVYFECNQEYHGLFQMVDYCRPLFPNTFREHFDRVIDLQVWPEKFDDFKNGDKTWDEFVFGLLPEGKDIDRQIYLSTPAIVTPPEIKDMVICFPCGFSQVKKHEIRNVIAAAHIVAKGRPVLLIGKEEHGLKQLDSIEEMCAYIKNAGDVVTINTSASILASAFRDKWWHLSDLPKLDFVHPKQIRIDTPNI